MNDLTDTEAVLCRYRYDALDRLAGVDSGTAEPVWRFYQKSRLSVEIQGALRRSVFQMDDQLLAEHRLSGSTGQSDLLGTDRQRSVLHTQGSQGAQSTAYSPYGHSPPANALPAFNGERRDPLTGHYLLGNGYRAYNPVLMRFNQPDSLSPFGRGGLNAYAYCQGDPVNRGDPSGHISSFSVPGLSMFPQIFPLQKLPNEILAKVLKYLPGKDFVSVASTPSPSLKQRVSGLSIVPRINIDGSRVLREIKKHLSGEALGVYPDRLKENLLYRSSVEQAVEMRLDKHLDLIEESNRAQQRFLYEVREEYRLLPVDPLRPRQSQVEDEAIELFDAEFKRRVNKYRGTIRKAMEIRSSLISADRSAVH